MNPDPCDCSALCPHGDRCLGGHSYEPKNHWYVCDKCTPKSKFSDLYAALRARARRGGAKP